MPPSLRDDLVGSCDSLLDTNQPHIVRWDCATAGWPPHRSNRRAPKKRRCATPPPYVGVTSACVYASISATAAVKQI